jgi:hypothetical protein
MQPQEILHGEPFSAPFAASPGYLQLLPLVKAGILFDLRIGVETGRKG